MTFDVGPAQSCVARSTVKKDLSSAEDEDISRKGLTQRRPQSYYSLSHTRWMCSVKNRFPIEPPRSYWRGERREEGPNIRRARETGWIRKQEEMHYPILNHRKKPGPGKNYHCSLADFIIGKRERERDRLNHANTHSLRL